jgi:hypothetical protein
VTVFIVIGPDIWVVDDFEVAIVVNARPTFGVSLAGAEAAASAAVEGL